jgi:lipopolysaccharide export system protein LptA
MTPFLVGAAITSLLTAVILGGGPVLAANPKHDVKGPVEIVADALEVQQNERIAVFAGNVEASQNNLKLNTARLTVHYAGEQTASISSNEINKLEARGGVVLSRPGEDATADWAVYDVRRRLITLGGHVVLTREGNVLRGERLTLDLNSGLSRVEGAPAPGMQVQSGSAGRVRGLFIPSQQKP